jgi:hypothetical protein
MHIYDAKSHRMIMKTKTKVISVRVSCNYLFYIDSSYNFNLIPFKSHSGLYKQMPY